MAHCQVRPPGRGARAAANDATALGSRISPVSHPGGSRDQPGQQMGQLPRVMSPWRAAFHKHGLVNRLRRELAVASWGPLLHIYQNRGLQAFQGLVMETEPSPRAIIHQTAFSLFSPR